MKNPPAFPLEVIYTQKKEQFNGMSLRDYFAAKAMQALIPEKDEDGNYWMADDVAELAYTQADYMMKAREA